MGTGEVTRYCRHAAHDGSGQPSWSRRCCRSWSGNGRQIRGIDRAFSVRMTARIRRRTGPAGDEDSLDGTPTRDRLGGQPGGSSRTKAWAKTALRRHLPASRPRRPRRYVQPGLPGRLSDKTRTIKHSRLVISRRQGPSPPLPKPTSRRSPHSWPTGPLHVIAVGGPHGDHLDPRRRGKKPWGHARLSSAMSRTGGGGPRAARGRTGRAPGSYPMIVCFMVGSRARGPRPGR